MDCKERRRRTEDRETGEVKKKRDDLKNKKKGIRKERVVMTDG
jgi:hypothetical protein